MNEYFNDKKFSRGFIVDSLTSMIIKSPSLILTLVLKCKRSIVNIHLVLCHSDFSKWAIAYEESQQENEFQELVLL